MGSSQQECIRRMRIPLNCREVGLGAILAVSIVACRQSVETDGSSVTIEHAEVCIDDSTTARGDPMEVIDPVWWTANIYDSPDAYDVSLQQFSKAQRLVFAMLWYQAEVNNGGHHQFYFNSTGIVWRDALEGFQASSLPEVAAI